MGALARTLGLLAALLVATAGCSDTEPAGPSEAPAWIADMGDVARAARRVSVRHVHGSADVERRGETWVRVDWADYPVRAGRMEEVFERLASARRLSDVEIGPGELHRVGLDGPLQPGELEFEVFDAKGRPLLALRLGAPNFAADVPARFASRRGDAPVVAGFPTDVDAMDFDPHPWVDRQLLLLGRDRVERFSITDAAGASWGASRSSPSQSEFTPSPPLAPDSLMPVFTALAARAPNHIAFEEVAAVDDLRRPAGLERSTYELETFDGMIVRLESHVAAGRSGEEVSDAERWLTVAVHARADASERAKAEAQALADLVAGRAFRVAAREISLLRSAPVTTPRGGD